MRWKKLVSDRSYCTYSSHKNNKLDSRDTDMCISYVYQYPADTDKSIHHFLKQSDMWIHLNMFLKNNIVHTRYKIKKQTIIFYENSF
jgi:hypothetical protein